MAESSRKAQTLKSVINNLNFSLDSISRLTRTGETYHCDVTQSPVTSPRDCVSGSSSFAVLAASGQTVQYKLETTDTSICGQPTGMYCSLCRWWSVCGTYLARGLCYDAYFLCKWKCFFLDTPTEGNYPDVWNSCRKGWAEFGI
jgi:hypothetical protein